MARRGILALTLVAVLIAQGLPVAGARTTGRLLITAVYYDTYVPGEGDEFVRILNPTSSSVSLKGWKLTDGEGTLTFPGASLAAGASMYVTARATDFRLDMVVDPQWEYRDDTDPGVPDLKQAGTFALSNAGDEVQLEKPDGTVVDAVVYAGGNTSASGWSGASVPGVGEGTILERDLDEATGAYADTDRAADWDDARIYVVGQSHFREPTVRDNGTVTAFASPDSGYDQVTSFLNATTGTLDVTVYELTNPALGDVLAARAQAGVKVRVLLEGQPVGMGPRERDTQNWILQQLTQAGGAARYMINNDTLGAHDRYDYVHAKYAVADGQRALVLSGNWKMTSLPVDPTWGNREWGVVVQSASLAAQLEQVFADDWNGAHRDILAFGNGTDPRYLPPDANFTPDRTVPGGSYAGHFAARTWTGPFNATPVLAPDTSLLDRSGLRPLLRSARSELLVEQLSAHAHWGDPRTGTPDSDPDPYLQDCIAAARAGAHVYVLLDSAFLDTGDTRNNQATVDYLDGIAANESLALQARLVNLTAVGVDEVHNKGVVVDNRTAVVGSLNWVRNSAQDNRELDLMLDDRDAAAYFRDVFFYDWDRSG